jgi:uncharacterized membrane protein HdeD (DUF308 family)
MALIYTYEAGSLNLPWWPSLFVGIVSLIAAAYVFTYPSISAVALMYAIAFWAIVAGLGEIILSLVTAGIILLVEAFRGPEMTEIWYS